MRERPEFAPRGLEGRFAEIDGGDIEPCLGKLAYLVARAATRDEYPAAPGVPRNEALERRLWSDWARRAAQLLRPGGLLFGLFFFDDNAKGPPFGIAAADLDAMLSGDFERREDEPVEDSLPVFAGKERWQVWKRREK